MTRLEELANRIEMANVGWLPGVGDIINVTFDISEAREVVAALKNADLASRVTSHSRGVPDA